MNPPQSLVHLPRRSNRAKPVAIVLALVCAAATYRAIVNAADWQTSGAKAREVIADPKSTDSQIRDALYVLYRNEVENAKAFEAASKRGGTAAKHAENLLAQVRDAWK